jgi:hydrogenase maturation protease
VIIGVGNPYRHDDGVGHAVARRLRDELGDAAVVREESGEGAALLEAWHGADAVYLLDAVSTGADAGTMVRCDAVSQPIPAVFFRHSSHAFSVAEAIELARALGQLPPRLIVYGVEGADFTAGVGLSSAVERAVEPVVCAVLDELGLVPSAARK